MYRVLWLLFSVLDSNLSNSNRITIKFPFNGLSSYGKTPRKYKAITAAVESVQKVGQETEHTSAFDRTAILKWGLVHNTLYCAFFGTEQNIHI